MSGVKGKSGGKRPNTGGYRPGAGAKKKPPELLKAKIAKEDEDDPVIFLTVLMKDSNTDIRVRADAAKALLAYQKAKARTTGKKEDKETAAKKAATGRFSPSLAPKIVGIKG